MVTKQSSKVVKATRKPPNAGKGRKKGVPNKATGVAREAFAMFVETNASKMQKWLNRVAEGVPVIDPDTNEQAERNGVPLWITPPAPATALDIIQRIAEYHIPKLARTEVVGDANQPVVHIYKWQDD